MLYNSTQLFEPFTLQQIQCQYGGKVYGVAYMRTEMPGDDGRQSLAQWLAYPANVDAARWNMQLALSCLSKLFWLTNFICALKCIYCQCLCMPLFLPTSASPCNVNAHVGGFDLLRCLSVELLLNVNAPMLRYCRGWRTAVIARGRAP